MTALSTAYRKAALYITVCMGPLPFGCGKPQPMPPAESFTVDVLNPYTPVKDQGRSHTCWIYAMLAAMETTHLSQGDSVNLSPAYAERALLLEAASEGYLTQGGARQTTRGMAQRLIDLMDRHGMVPYDAYHRGERSNATVLLRKVRGVVGQSVAGRLGLASCLRRVGRVLDEDLGPAPRRVYMLGAEYTPQEFARSVCAPGEYEALTSFTHHPFHTRFVLEVPDNVGHSQLLNVPIDTLMARIDEAVGRGQGVCWEGDTSEPGFSFGQGRARLPQGTPTSQEARQRAFERFATTDDHCMAIVGTAHDSRGNNYYIMKNSWGSSNPHGGLMYVSADYVRLKTIAVYLPHR